jgi:hypothetical protein
MKGAGGASRGRRQEYDPSAALIFSGLMFVLLAFACVECLGSPSVHLELSLAYPLSWRATLWSTLNAPLLAVRPRGVIFTTRG